jgi:hypothetical protein
MVRQRAFSRMHHIRRNCIQKNSPHTQKFDLRSCRVCCKGACVRCSLSLSPSLPITITYTHTPTSFFHSSANFLCIHLISARPTSSPSLRLWLYFSSLTYDFSFSCSHARPPSLPVSHAWRACVCRRRRFCWHWVHYA